jgi:16S rRNA U516 pseudouridylate synthase RsuA-like enzyme
VRTAVGPVRLANLKPGKWRPLRPAELGQLYQDVGL